MNFNWTSSGFGQPSFTLRIMARLECSVCNHTWPVMQYVSSYDEFVDYVDSLECPKCGHRNGDGKDGATDWQKERL